jgi:uncharacterized protein YukE
MVDLNPIDDVVDAATDVVEAGVDVATDVVDAGVDVATDVAETGLDVASGAARTAFGVLTGNPASALPDVSFQPRTPDGPGFLERIFHRIGTLGEFMNTSDEVLDNFKGFQSGFETYIPLYDDYTGASLDFRTDIVEPYDTLRGIDFHRLGEVARGCAEVADKFTETMDTLDTDVGTHTSGWRGDASNAFLAHIQRFGTAAKAIDTDLGRIADTTSDSVTAVQQVFRDYTEALLGVDWGDFDSPDTIRLLITVSRMELDVSDLVEKLYDFLGDVLGIALPSLGGGIPIIGDAINWVVDRFGEAVATVLDAFGFGENIEQLVSWVAGVAKEYLDATFVAPFDANHELFDSATQTATDATTQAFQPVIDAAGQIQPVSYDDAPIDDPGASSTPNQTDSNNNTSTSSQSDSNGSTTPSQTSNSSTTPSSSTTSSSSTTPSSADQSSTQPSTTQPTTTPTVPQPTVPGQQDGTQQTRPAGLPPNAGWVSDPSKVPPGWTMNPATGELKPPAGQDSQVPGQTPGTPTSPKQGAPEGLPKGAGWVADPSALPKGWTVDPATGQMFAPDDPAGESFPEVHSPEGEAALAGDQPGGGVPGDGGEVTVEDGDRKISVTGLDDPGDEVDVTITEADGTKTEYEIGLDENGRPELGPDSPSSATVSTPDTDPGGATGAGGTGAGGATGGGAGGGTHGGGTHGGGGTGGGGHVGGGGGTGGSPAGTGSLPAGNITHAGPLTAEATAAAGAATGAGAAAGGGQGGGPAGMGMMPMGAGMAGQGGGDEERGPSQWRVQGNLLTPEEQAELDRPRAVIGVDPADKEPPKPKLPQKGGGPR